MIMNMKLSLILVVMLIKINKKILLLTKLIISHKSIVNNKFKNKTIIVHYVNKN